MVRLAIGRKRSWLASAIFATMVVLACQAWAGPRGGGQPGQPGQFQVISGSVNVQQNGLSSGSQITIRASNHSIIDWQSFNIPAGETVRFIQPSASATVLNRILGGGASHIDGVLQANGIVYLVNPSGLAFGPSSVVNVGQIYAVAGHLSNQDFQSGVNHFTNLTGSVTNAGLITGEAAQVHLVGQQVANYGTIVAPHGIATLSAGGDVYLTEGSDGHILVKIDNSAAPAAVPAAPPAASAAPAAAQGQPAGARPGEHPARPVSPTASPLAAGDIYSLAIQNTGTVRANQINIQAGKGQAVTVSGRLDASDASPTGKGGTVRVLGDKVELVGAQIDASGGAGGGQVLIGGDLHGQNPQVPNASRTIVSSDSTIKADATQTGDGGKVVVWSDTVTTFLGQIFARGGPQAGNGGNVEVSGRSLLDFQGTANRLAPNGRAGTLLLDPMDLELNDTTTDINVTPASPFTPAAAATTPSVLTWTTIRNALAGGPVVVTTVGSPDSLNKVQTGAIDITAASGNLGSANSLTIQAAGNLTVNGAIQNSGAGNLVLEGQGAGGVTIGNPITLGGSLTVTAPNGIALAANVSTTGSQTYNHPVTLFADTALASGGLTWFKSTVNGNGDGTHSLAIGAVGGAGGNARFDGAVGAAAPLQSVTVAGPTIMNGGLVMTIADQTYTGAVTLQANATLTAGGLTWFKSAVNGAVADGQALTIVNNARFDGPVGSAAVPLNGVSVGGTTVLGGGSVTTGGNQVYAGAVTLQANTVLVCDALVWFQSTLDGSAPGGQSLAIQKFGGIGGNAQFDLAVGGATPLGPLSVAGTTLLNGGSVTTTGGQVYTGAVTLRAGNTLLTSGGPITFASTLNGNGGEGRRPQNLTLTAPGSDIHFVGRVGGIEPLGDVVIANAARTTADAAFVARSFTQAAGTGDVTLTGGLSTRGPTGGDPNGGNITITTTGNITIGGNLDASGFNPAADPAGNIALQANRNNTNTPPFGNLPDGIIQFKGAALQVLARGAAGGDVTLNGTGRDTVPSVSSIGATGNISFQCNSLAMGDRTNPAALTAHSEKFTVLGNLTINATGAVWLGDISALNAVQVTAGAITLLARPGGQVLARVGANGAQLGDDLGTDIVAGSITFNVAPTGVIGGVNLLASPTRAGSVPGSAIDRYTGTVATADLFWDPPVPVFLDLRGKGPVVGGVGPAPFNLASALPQLDTKLPGLLPPLVESIDVALAKELRRLGIYARFVTRDERLHVIGGGWVFDDLLASAVLNPPQRDIVAGEVAGDPDVENSAFQVSERRLSPVQAAEAVRLYRSLYKVIDKDTGKETDRSGEIVARLDAAATAYRQAGGVTEIDGAGFRKFLASDPKNAPALVELEGLSELFRTVRVMGLTDKELQISRNTLLGQLKTEAMSKDELRSAVESR